MIDFLKAHPGMKKDEYLWEWTVPQVRLAMCDNTHVEYLTEEQAKKDRLFNKAKKYSDANSLANDLGIPIF